MRFLSVGAIILGAVAGVLIAALVSLIVWGFLLIPEVENPADPALMAGVVLGLVGAGYAAGRLTRPSASHGTLAGLVMAVIVGVVSIASGSPAPPLAIITLIVLAAALGRLGGGLAGRR